MTEKEVRRKVAKYIDPVDIKQAIKRGQLEVVIKEQKGVRDGVVYTRKDVLIRDAQTTDTIKICEVIN